MTSVLQTAVICTALSASAVFAQAPTTPPAGRAGGRAGGTPATALHSPDVNADRTVTLRFRAPLATEVDVVGEITRGAGPQPMTKDENGVWSVTLVHCRRRSGATTSACRASTSPTRRIRP